MAFRYLIDSWAWMENFTGTEAGTKVEKILKEGSCCTTIVTIAELADKFLREGEDFLPHLEFIKTKAVILPVTEEIALSAAEIKKDLRKRAKKASLIDAINLATARQQKAVLVTGDSDFEGVKDVMMIN